MFRPWNTEERERERERERESKRSICCTAYAKK